MRKKILGTDLKVSAIGLGCMGMNHAYGASVDKTEIIPGTGRIKYRICGVFTTGKWIFVW